ncbi:Triacylglycerol Lipase [Seminavis robusta]|uniref:Triacylglycerol Lipase n=1 Tax=Seminavis robusta TaxID=568900 RepID=A0A9N8EDE8_9STRA|nr:Triacylglycerol Lipase [Seminavis robusta]|eukprot:Sro781_g201520.1 Triacylglycerol Lipase (654) ;mRNA; f:3082-5206
MSIDSHQSSVSHVWFWTILLLCGLGGRMIRRQRTGTANRLVHAQPGLHVHALQYSQSFEQNTSSGEDRSLRSGESAATPVTSNLSKAETAADDNATLSENGSTGQARHGIGPPTRDNNGLEPTQMVPGVAVPDAITIRSNDMERLGNEAFLVLATDTRTPRRCNVGREQYYETEEAVETAPTEEQRSLLTVIALLALSGGGVSAKENVRGTLPVDSQSSETEKLDLHDHATIISMANAQSERDTTESSILECGTSMPVKGRVQYNSDEEQQEVLTATNDHGNLICTMNSRSDNDMDTSGGDGANSPVDTLFLASSIETNPSVGSTKYDNYRFASNDEADKSLTSWRGRNASYLYELENEVLEAGNRIDESLKEVLNMFEESLKPPSEVYTQVEEELSFAASDLSLHTNKLSVKGCHESDTETTGPDVFFECNPAMQGEHEPAAIEAPSLWNYEATVCISAPDTCDMILTLLRMSVALATQIDRSMQEVMNMSATQSLKGGDRHSDREEDVSLTDSSLFFPTLGTPHQSAPGPAFEGVQWCNEEPAPVRSLAVGGTGFKGDEWGAMTQGAYSFCCNQGTDGTSYTGDGMTPIDSALSFDGAEQLAIQNVTHFSWDTFGAEFVAPELAKDYSNGRPWYGSKGIVEKWADWIVQHA